MTWVLVFVVVGVVLAIAAALVFREAARLSDEPPDAVFDPDDALGWVVEHLDDLAAATLTEKAVGYIVDRCAATGEAYLPEQVEAVMECQLEYLRYIGAIGREADDET